MNIGVFSGSFDPIHMGHAMVANYLAQYCGLDEVWLMPSPLNPLKVANEPVSAIDRLEMCRLIAKRCENVHVSDFELSLPLPTYTYRTLSLLREKFPQHRFYLVIGSDNWLLFDKWRNRREIISEFNIIVYPRPGYPVDDLSAVPDTVRILTDAPQALISSTFIREGLTDNRNMNFFLDSDVIGYINNHHLYERK